MKKQFLMLCLLGLMACQSPSQSNYVRNVKAWIGHTPEELVTAWGSPTQVLQNGTDQFYLYSVQKVIPLPGTSSTYAQGPTDYISPLQGTSAAQTDLYCETTFIVRDDRIVDWSFMGNNCVAK